MLTEQKQRIIVESKMSIGQIQLGVKKGSGESLDRYSVQGFFYGGGVLRDGQRQESSRLVRPRTGRDDTEIEANPTCQHLIFYDNPSSKRLARCTNIPHTGATLQVWAREQRLRKGFQGQQGRGSLTYGSIPFRFECGDGYPIQTESSWLRRCRPTACLESLSSAAANKAPGEKYGVIINKTLPCLNS